MANVGNIPQMFQIRMPNGEWVNFADWNSVPLWSTGDFLTGFDDERVELFTYLPSDPVASTQNITEKRIATESDTNMAINNGMASTEQMFVYSVQAEYIELGTDSENPTDATTAECRQDVNPYPLIQRLGAFQYNLKFELEVSQKVKFECVMAQINAGFGPTSSPVSLPSVAATPTNSVANNGTPGRQAVAALAIPVLIGQQEKYIARIRNPTSNAIEFGGILPEWDQANNVLFRVKIFLDGLHKIPVA